MAIPGQVFVSNASAAKDHQLLSALGVAAVISVGGGKLGAAPGIKFMHFGIKDRSDTTYLPVFRGAADFVYSILHAGQNILVHCRGGMHRSPAVAAALLVRFAGLSAIEAMDCVRSARPIADFNSNDGHLSKQLHLYEQEVRNGYPVASTSETQEQVDRESD